MYFAGEQPMLRRNNRIGRKIGSIVTGIFLLFGVLTLFDLTFGRTGEYGHFTL